MKYIFKTVFIVFFIVLTGCSENRTAFNTEVIYKAGGFSSETFSNQTVLFLPVYYEKGFDTASINLPENFIKKYLKQRNDLKFIYRDEFEKVFSDSCGFKNISPLYETVFGSSVLKIKKRDCFWKNIPAKYLLLIKIVSGGRIKNFDKTITRKIHIEGEIWDSDIREAVWRAAVKGIDNNAASPDKEYIHRGIKEIIQKLPEFRYSNPEKKW